MTSRIQQQSFCLWLSSLHLTFQHSGHSFQAVVVFFSKKNMILLAVAVLLACAIVGLWIYARWNHGVLEKLGIPIVSYTNPILGSTKEVYETVGGLQDVKWMKKYGPVFGVYEGRQAQVFVCVPELIRLICVKEAEYFNSKRQMEFGDALMNEFPDFMPLEKWKVVRSMLTPAFTSAKVKLMNLPMREATQEFSADLKLKIKTSGKGLYEKLPIDTALHTFLTDLIARACFSVKISGTGSGENNEFTQLVKDLFTPPSDVLNQEVIMYTHAFPFLRKYLPSTVFKPDISQKFIHIFKQMLEERRRSGQRRNDIMDMVLEWYDKLDTPEYRKARVTELTLICQALVFFMAAQDQIAMMVAAVIYHMTKDPDLERRIYTEVDKVFAKHNGKIGHEHLGELQLMNSSLEEALRLYSVFHRTERVCTKEWKNDEYNLEIKEGTVIIIPIWALNRNSEYTENAEEFDADRFMPENKDKLNVFATTSFGHGPRNCTGKRFATEAMPLILAYLLKEFRFIGREDTELKFTAGGPFFTLHEPIYVDVVGRS